MRKRILVAGLLIVLALAVLAGEDPFHHNFVRITIPSLLLLNSLQWFNLPQKPLWRLVGFCLSLSVTVLFLRVDILPGDGRFVDITTVFFVGMAIHSSLLYALAGDRLTRRVILAASITIAFLVLFGTYANMRHLEFPLGATRRLLFLCPLAAMALYAGSAIFRWQKWTQIVFLCIVAQVGVGLLDVGGTNKIRWLSISAFGLWFAGLCLLAFWSKEWPNGGWRRL